ncbi:MAG: D-alanyl-D-alanine carboxypeptidase [Actinomycetia bacterium]|nr:D-alanyl-D-alanine carboxypeptidase [Actinomycetes bacterium]
MSLIRRILSLILVGLLCFSPSAFASVQPGDMIGRVPYTELKLSARSMPDVTMQAGILVSDSGQVLWSRNADERRQIASITKIMTAILSIQMIAPDKSLTVPSVTLEAQDSTAGLKAGEVLTRHQLLQAMLIPSGNDAAKALAVLCSGSEAAFVQKMNEKARELGMTNTRFVDPDGVADEGPSSSAADVATMARYAMTLPEFREVSAEREVKFVTNLATHEYKTTNDLLLMYTGASGVKTGFTDAAGYCLVGSASRQNVQLFAVVLGTEKMTTRFYEAADLLDFGFTHYRPQKLAMKGTILGRSTISDYLDRQIPVALSHDATANVNDLEGAVTRKVIIWEQRSPVRKGQQLGMVRFIQNGRQIASTPLVSTQSLDRPFILMRLWYAIVKGWRKL